METTPKKIVYISGSHWDREWYLSFQSFRFRLVTMLNEVIDVLERDDSFGTYTMDGQTVVLEDFLQVEPEKKERIRALISAGRMRVGPWYAMPDENLVSGESLVRNLIIGHRIAKEFGASPMKCGFVCDIFGHTAQLPQILAKGFNINSALLGRGTNDYDCPAHFMWEAPDGSKVAAFKVPEECGYGSFWLDVWDPYLNGSEPDREQLVVRACRYVESEMKRSGVPYVFLMDNMDHEHIHKDAPWLAKRLAEHYGCPVVIDSPDAVVEEILSYEKVMPTKYGELQHTAREMTEHNKLIPNVLSSRYDIKLANDNCQTLLEKWVSPLMAVGALGGVELQRSYYSLAYEYLIKNHCHDSICGCSIDEVHQDMQYRFRQCAIISREMIDFLLNARIVDDKVFAVSLFNPLPHAVTGVQIVRIPFPEDYAQKYDEQIPSEQINAFLLIDEDGNEIPYNIMSITKNSNVRVPCGNYSKVADVYEVALPAKIPAMGAVSVEVKPCGHPVRYMDTMITSGNSAENEYIVVDINRDGTVCLTDKSTGQRYDGLLDFEDNGDAGDGWFHYAPPSDRTVSGGCVTIERLYGGSNICEFRIVRAMNVPAKMVYDRRFTGRSDETMPLEITVSVVLKAGARALDVRVTVNNRPRDHRLKLLVPTGIADKTYFAEQAFAFVERPVGVDNSTGMWKEFDKVERPFSGVLFKRSGNRGLAILSSGGLHEAAGLDDKNGTLAVTLFRSFGKTFMTDGQTDGQLDGKLEFAARIMPLAAEDMLTDMLNCRDEMAVGIRLFEGVMKKSEGFSIPRGNVYVSVIKPAENEDGVVLRLVNYSDKPSDSKVACPSALTKAWECSMLEKRERELSFDGGLLCCELKPWEIKTVILTR